jgi:hypothetical protein
MRYVPVKMKMSKEPYSQTRLRFETSLRIAPVILADPVFDRAGK